MKKKINSYIFTVLPEIGYKIGAAFGAELAFIQPVVAVMSNIVLWERLVPTRCLRPV